MSQQIMSIVSILQKILAEAGDMGDIEYLSKKEFDSKRVDVNATLSLNNTSTETDLVTQTANTGKDMYLGAASFNGRITNQAGGELGSVTYVLYINGFEKERWVKENPSDTEADNADWAQTFTTKGVKVAPAQIIKITAQNGTSGVNRITGHSGKLILWEEDMETTPAI